MKEDKDYTKRIEGHTEPLEIEEHYTTTPKVAAAKTTPTPKAASGHAGGGGIGWAALGGIAAAFIVCAVYVGSGFRKAPDSGMMITETEIFAVPSEQSTSATQTAQTTTPTATPAHADADAVYIFPLEGSKITESAELNQIAEEAKESGAEVEIMAYTDPSGSDAYNQKLSERRAQAVADYLAAHGVDPAHIHAHGCGPTTDFATAAQDRRAEVHLM